MPNVYDRQGNLHVVDSAQQAQAMVQSGQFAFPPGEKVQVADAGGRVFDVDATQAPAAFEQGMSLASDEAVAKVNRQEQYGGFGGAAASLGFHGLNTLGLNAATEALIQSKAKLHGVDPEVIRREVLGLTEENPVASGVGTGLGLVAPALLSGGSSLATEGNALTKGLYGAGRVLTAPGRAVGALGEGVGGLVGKALGEEGAGFISKLATRGATMGAQGATEMGVYGGAATIGEASLGDDHELTAEKFWSGVGQGALYGLIGGAGLGALSATGSSLVSGAKDLLSGVRSRGTDVEALAERTFGESADGLGSAYSKASAALSGKDAEAIRGLTRLDAEGREARRLAVFEGDATRAEAARELRTNINQMQEATRNLSPEWREAKAANVAKTIDRAPEAAAKQSAIAQDSLLGVRQKLEEMAADPVMFDQRMVKKLSKPLEVAERRMGAAIEAGKQEDVFVALDTFKRDMGRLDLAVEKGMPSIERETRVEVRKLYEDVRGALTDQAWGKAGEMQRDVNAAYEKWMQTKSLFDQRFETQTGRQAWEKTYGADPAKIEGYVNGLTSPRNDLTHSIIEQHIASTKALAEELSKAGELTPAKAAELAAVKNAAQSFEKTVGKAEKSLVLTNQLRELERADHSAGAGVLGAIGGMMGGPVGAAIGAGIGALANPARVVRQLAAVERIAARVDAKLGAGVKSFVHGGAVEMPKAPATAGSVAERFEKESKAIRTFAGNPQVATERISKGLAGLNQVAPSVASQLAFKAAQTAQALAQMLPAGATAGGILPQFEKVRYSEADQEKWLHAKDVIANPVDAMLRGMASGHLPPGDVALVKQHSPKVYAQMQQMAMAELGNVKSPPSYQRKIQMGILFGVPADKTLQPDFIQMTQGAYQAQAQAAQQQRKPAGGGGSRTTLKQQGATASEAVEGS